VALPRIPGYQIIRLAGAGGFGSVFEARRSDDYVRVAIKVAHTEDPYAIRRLWYEALALRTVGPPEVPELLDDGTTRSDLAYLAMEWISAPSLADRLHEIGGAMSLAEFGIITPPILRAVDALHRRGFVHRDLKPDHIMLDRSEGPLRVRLLDLGLVVPTSAPEPHRVRARGLALGTSRYMAPEQVAAEPIGTRADIYALGVILFEMLSGTAPFAGTSTQMREAHLLIPAPRVGPLSLAPAAVERVINRCLDKRPERRYASASTLRGALTKALRQAGVLPRAG
jgi:serine/threonine protein kinase